MNRAVIEFTIERLLAIHNNEQLRDRFSLSLWGDSSEVHAVDQPEPDCGFSGCYIGWAIHQQWFARWGLRLAFEKAFGVKTPSKQVVPVVLGSSDPAYQKYAKVREGQTSPVAIEAVADLLDICVPTLEKVIYEEAYENEQADPLKVALRLREILDLGEEPFMDLQIEREERWAADAR